MGNKRDHKKGRRGDKMSMYEIITTKTDKNQQLYHYIIKLKIRRYGAFMDVWFRKTEDIFKIELGNLPYTMKDEERDAIIDELFKETLNRKECRVKAIVEGWEEKGYIIENTEHDWGWNWGWDECN
jgi:hypothetical protein